MTKTNERDPIELDRIARRYEGHMSLLRNAPQDCRGTAFEDECHGIDTSVKAIGLAVACLLLVAGIVGYAIL